MSGKTLLTLVAVLNFGIALLHLAIIFVGASGYLYFGAADLAIMASQGSLVPAVATLILTLIFAGFGLYALSGASVIRRLPLLTVGLIFIGSIYTLRGLIVVLDLIGLALGEGYPLRQTVFSAVALTIGLMCLVGTIQQWNYLKTKAA